MSAIVNEMSDVQDERWWEAESLLQFESPTSILIVGPSSSGKTELTKKLLLNKDGVFKSKVSKIMLCYNVWQNTYEDLKSKMPDIQFYKGLPNANDIEEWGASKQHKILVMDDLMMEAANNLEVVNLFCVGSHHMNITVIHLVQNLFAKGRIMKSLSLNCHYFILFRNNRDQLQYHTFGRQVFPGMLNFFIDAMNKATMIKYGYLLVDLNPHTDKKYQLRTNILPGENTLIFQSLK